MLCFNLQVTDGKANAGFDPKIEALKLHDANINVFAIGVGKGASKEELDDIASDPDEDHSYLVRSFSQIFSIIDEITHSACDAKAALKCGESVDLTVAEGSATYLSVPSSLWSINLTVTTSSGSADVYASGAEVQTPGPFNHVYKSLGSGAVGSTQQITVVGTDKTQGGLSVGIHSSKGRTGSTVLNVAATCSDGDVVLTTTTSTTTTRGGCDYLITRGASRQSYNGVYSENAALASQGDGRSITNHIKSK